MKKKITIIIVLLAFAAGPLAAQVNFIFLADVYGRSVDGLGNFQMQNFSPLLKRGQVFITVNENITKTQVLTIISPVFDLGSGNMVYPVSVFASSKFNFTSTSLSAIVSQTRNFPPGDYTFCYRFVPSDKTEDFENCFDANIQPLVPISLINPADQDKICQKRPALSWQPPVPYPAAMRFRLQLTEKKKGAAVENLLMNAPLILLDNIPSTTVNFPSYAPDLQEGHTYVWQVIAYQNGVILSKSEIWEFTVQCSDPVKPDINDSYRELRDMVNGNYYYATRFLKFSFQNSYNVKKLSYEIYQTEGGSTKIKNLPVIPIVHGLNKIDIDLTALDLEDGKHYVLKIYPFNEPDVVVRFVYSENDPTNE